MHSKIAYSCAQAMGLNKDQPKLDIELELEPEPEPMN